MSATAPKAPAQTVAYAIEDRLYLNITDRCTLRCAFCPKHRGSRAVRGHDLSLDHRPDTDEILAAVGDPRPWREIVFCGYGEPTLRLGTLLEVAHALKARGAARVRVNTDGLACLVHKRDVLPELGACVDAVSVSMNAQNPAVYAHHCRPALAGSWFAMLEFLERAPRHIGEVTATAIDGLEGVDVAACERLARAVGVRFRRRVLDVVG
ncbi:TatD family nuclease-associated radical SAM protein [Inmirania thermothiophila]|uniref:TatD family-associated radical SAM protein n=1 Tax=Inmirania thermothiophila TaxID=1750597 RepID=A0A3N1XXC5_9GAMM|nr:TatD family nuclease-associated radical SAM protein [Inmirania thermothiophila]ROR29587.1 TatD family-associated radical SAM protein [Inmirania thermothiophila]